MKKDEVKINSTVVFKDRWGSRPAEVLRKGAFRVRVRIGGVIRHVMYSSLYEK